MISSASRKLSAPMAEEISSMARMEYSSEDALTRAIQIGPVSSSETIRNRKYWCQPWSFFLSRRVEAMWASSDWE